MWWFTLLACSPCQLQESVPPHTPVHCNDLFDPDKIVDVHLDLDPEVWASLHDEHAHWEERLRRGLPIKPYHPVRRLEIEGDTVTDAQIRLKGNPCCSWTEEKLQFVISFNETDDDGRFRGLRKLNLDAPPYDASLLRERIALSYFADAGFAASCSNHAKLFVNGAYYGLYTNIEAVDGEFIQRQYPEEPVGDLYKWDYLTSRFEKRNHRDEGTRELQAYLAIDDQESFERLVDTRQAVDFWAAEAVINQADGYWAGSINFYLYLHPTKGWQYLPWDLDQSITWWPAFKSPFNRRDAHGAAPLVDLLLSTPGGRVRFAQSIDAAHATHDIDTLLARMDRWAEQIRPHVEADPHRSFSMGDFEREVAKIRDRLASRHRYLCQRDWDSEPDPDGSHPTGTPPLLPFTD